MVSRVKNHFALPLATHPHFLLEEVEHRVVVAVAGNAIQAEAVEQAVPTEEVDGEGGGEAVDVQEGGAVPVAAVLIITRGGVGLEELSFKKRSRTMT